MRLRLFTPLRATITSSAQSLVPPSGRPSQESSLPILTSFNHLIDAGEQRGRQFETERLGGRKIDDEIELRGLLDRDVARLRAAQDLVDIIGGASILVRDAWSIGHQTSRFDILPQTVHRRQSRA